MPVVLGDFTPGVLEDVLRIERASFSDPWPASAFMSEVGTSWSWFRLAYRMNPEPLLAGYLIAWLLPGDMHLLNLAVAPRLRRRGVATTLLEDALAEFASRGGGVACLEVRPSNTAARLTYEKLGFVGVGMRPRYYRRDGEDAMLMARRIDATAAGRGAG